MVLFNWSGDEWNACFCQGKQLLLIDMKAIFSTNVVDKVYYEGSYSRVQQKKGAERTIKFLSLLTRFSKELGWVTTTACSTSAYCKKCTLFRKCTQIPVFQCNCF